MSAEIINLDDHRPPTYKELRKELFKMCPFWFRLPLWVILYFLEKNDFLEWAK